MAAIFDFQHKLDDQYHHSSPSSLSHGRTSITRFLTAGAIGTSLVALSALTLTATVISLIMATPVLLFFSPVKFPAAIAMFLITGGFVFSGGCGAAAITALTWLYKYVSNYVSSGRRDYAYDASYGSRARFGF